MLDWSKYRNPLPYKTTSKDAMRKYFKLQFELDEKFKHDALRRLGLLDDPRAEDVFKLAWDRASEYKDPREVFDELRYLAQALGADMRPNAWRS